MAKIIPTITAPVLEGRDLYESVLSPEQADACEEFIAVVEAHRADGRAFTLDCAEVVGRAFPRPVDKPTWTAVAGDITERLRESANDSYGRKCLAAAYKALHGALPAATNGKPDAKKPGASPKKTANGLSARVAAIVDYVAKMDKRDINARVLARLITAVDSLAVVADAMQQEAQA